MGSKFGKRSRKRDRDEALPGATDEPALNPAGRIANFLVVDPDTGGVTEPATAPEPPPVDYAAVGEEVSALLRHAHDTAETIRTAAEAEAERITGGARAAADRVLEETRAAADAVRAEAGQVRAEAERYDAETRSAADTYAEQRRRAADEEAARIEAEVGARRQTLADEVERHLREADATVRERNAALLAETENLQQRLEAALTELRELSARLESVVGHGARPYAGGSTTDASLEGALHPSNR